MGSAYFHVHGVPGKRRTSLTMTMPLKNPLSLTESTDISLARSTLSVLFEKSRSRKRILLISLLHCNWESGIRVSNCKVSTADAIPHRVSKEPLAAHHFQKLQLDPIVVMTHDVPDLKIVVAMYISPLRRSVMLHAVCNRNQNREENFTAAGSQRIRAVERFFFLTPRSLTETTAIGQLTTAT
jgi:hypothetical protein